MNESELKKLSKRLLKKKEKSFKIYIGIFIPIITFLFFFGVKDYVQGGKIDFATLTIAFCSLAAFFSILPKFKAIRKELKNRD